MRVRALFPSAPPPIGPPILSGRTTALLTPRARNAAHARGRPQRGSARRFAWPPSHAPAGVARSVALGRAFARMRGQEPRSPERRGASAADHARSPACIANEHRFIPHVRCAQRRGKRKLHRVATQVSSPPPARRPHFCARDLWRLRFGEDVLGAVDVAHTHTRRTHAHTHAKNETLYGFYLFIALLATRAPVILRGGTAQRSCGAWSIRWRNPHRHAPEYKRRVRASKAVAPHEIWRSSSIRCSACVDALILVAQPAPRASRASRSL